jgi:hypothetical protein
MKFQEDRSCHAGEIHLVPERNRFTAGLAIQRIPISMPFDEIFRLVVPTGRSI